MSPETPSPRWVTWLLGVVWAIIAVASVGLVLLLGAQDAISEFSAGLKKKVVEAAQEELGEEPAAPSTIVMKADAATGGGPAKIILAVGSDRRAGEKGKGRSDTTMLVRVADGTVSMLSLPRDLRVPIPGHGTDKLNAAYSYGGMKLLIKTLREYLGVKIDHFVQVDFGGFKDVVGEIGGVYLPIDGRYFNENTGTAATNYADIDLQPGYQRLSSEKALQFVRFRHLDSDFSRAARQQLFLREVGRQLQARASDVGALPGLVESIAKATTSDLASVQETISLAEAMRSTPPDRVNRVVLEGASAMLGGVSYVVSSSAQKQRSLRRWAHPGQRITLQRKRGRAQRRSAGRRKRATVRLVPDGGQGRRLARGIEGVTTCAPTGLPAGYRWGGDTPARSYTLHGKRAGAMWATAGSGRSVLLMFSRWQSPPVLAKPSETIRLQGEDVQLFYESGRLRTVAWRMGGTRAWITNTLANALSDRQLIALARSCLA